MLRAVSSLFLALLVVVGAQAQSSCTGPNEALNTLNGRCYQVPASCTSLNSVNCSQRSDCTNTNGVCTTGAAPGSVGSKTTWNDCQTANGYWDVYVGTGKCFYSLQEVNSLYPCTHWSGYPYTFENFACKSHGCAATGSVCFSADIQQANPDVSVSTSFEFNVLSALVLPNSLTYTARVAFPLAQVANSKSPQLMSLAVGANEQITPHFCNSISYQPPLGTPVGPSSYADQVGLATHIVQTIQSTNTLTFNASTAVGSAALHVVGGWNVNKTLGGSIVSSVLTTDDMGTLLADVQIDLNQCVALCGCTRVAMPTYTYYTLMLSASVRTDGDNVGRSSQLSAISINTYGTVQIDGNTNTLFRVLLQLVTSARGDCPLGQQARTLIVRETYTNPDSTLVIGLRNTSDLYVRPGNCFGDKVISVVPPTTCPGGRCETTITIRGRCVPVTTDLNALNLCNHQLAANRIADLGSDIAYSSVYNFNHDFYHYPRSWRVSVGVSDPSFASVGVDTVSGDLVGVTSNQAVFPDVSFASSLIYVRAGFLPSPNAPLSSNVTVFATFPNTTRLVAPSSYFTNDLTIVGWLAGKNVRQTFGFRIDIASLLITPINPFGQVTTFSTPITWDRIAAVATTTPREQCALVPVCVIGAARATEVGVDTLSVPMFWAQTLAPATGYRVTYNYNITLPVGTPMASGAVSRRRLLQASDGDGEQIVEGMASMDIQGLTPPDTAAVDLGPTQESATSSVAVTAGVVGGSVAGGAGVMGSLAWVGLIAL